MRPLGSMATYAGQPVRIVGRSNIDANLLMPDGSIEANVKWSRLSDPQPTLRAVKGSANA